MVHDLRATVVIATHDRPDYALRAVRSALAQTVPVEVVVVDDGSTPPFVPGLDDPRLRIVRREVAGGMCAARNDGLAVARGEWVTFLDDDDVLEPRMVEAALDAAERSSLPGPVAVMTAVSIVGADGTEVDRCRPPTLSRGEDYFLEGKGDRRAKNALVIPTRVAQEIGGWDDEFVAFEADDFGIRLNQAASIVGLDEPLYQMTHHEAPRLTQRIATIPRDMERTLAKHRAVFRRHRREHAAFMSTIGMYDLRAGQWAAALRWTLRGLLRDPRRRRGWFYFGAALAGPHALRLHRRLWPRESAVTPWVLTKRRLRKYGRRLVDYPRAAIGEPAAWSTRWLVRRRVDLDGGEPTRSVLVLCVYRAANAGIVETLLRDAARRHWDVRLWALDEVEPRLAGATVGSGPGAKFPLLNGLVRDVDLDRYDWVVVTDDDIAFRAGSVDELLMLAEAAGLDLVQPAHTETSFRDNEIVVRRPLSVARRTTYVEIGPLLAVHAPLIERVLPFGAEYAMGWGLELEWFDLARAGAAIGVVDAVAVRHLHPVGKRYVKDVERRRLREAVTARGLASFADAQRTVGTWRPWRSVPPWECPGTLAADPVSTGGAS